MIPQWQYRAFRLPDLAELHPDLPLTDVTFSASINGSGVLSASLNKATAFDSVRISEQFGEAPVIEEKGTLIVASDEGNDAHYAFIVDEAPQHATDQDQISISGTGHLSTLDKLPWLSSPFDGVRVDPLDIARLLILEASSYQDSLAVTVDDTRSDIRIGDPLQDVEFSSGDGDVSFESGPRPRLARYRTPDMLKVFNDMAEEGTFEYAEQTSLSLTESTPPELHIRLGYPYLPTPVRDDLLFEFGLNVSDINLADGLEYASHVYVLGAGEGASRKQGEAMSEHRRRLRTVRVIDDKSLQSDRQCRLRAERILHDIETAQNILSGDGISPAARFIEKFRVHDSPAARVGSFHPGDVIEVSGRLGWGLHWQSCRILTIEHRVADGSCAVTVEPWEVDEFG